MTTPSTWAHAFTIPAAVTPLIDINPLEWLGEAAKEGVADGFTSMMMSLWSAALWLLQAVFGILDQFTTPQLNNPGLNRLYGLTAGISLIIALLIAFGQLGLAAIRRDGRSFGTLVIGLVQYGAVMTTWIALCTTVVLGCAGLTKALLSELLDVDSFSGYAAGAGWVDHVSGTVEAAVLGVCALFLLIPAAFGYLLIMLAREGALLVLVATLPIAAAGALGEGTRAWMWKSIRWFLVACLTSPLLALVLGIGVQIGQAAIPAAHQEAHERTSPESETLGAASTSFSPSPTVPQEQTTQEEGVPDTAANVGMAVVGCVIMLVGCFCPMALFRLLAFVDPGTGSGAAFRSTLAANGGVAGILTGPRGDATAPANAAQQTADDGRSASEASADTLTTARFSTKLAHAVPAVGRAVGTVLTGMGGIASQGASLSVDVMGQAGVGHQGYYDTTPTRRPSQAPTRTGRAQDPLPHGTGPRASQGVVGDPPASAGAEDVLLA